jgi:hypothetical protein
MVSQIWATYRCCCRVWVSRFASLLRFELFSSSSVWLEIHGLWGVLAPAPDASVHVTLTLHSANVSRAPAYHAYVDIFKMYGNIPPIIYEPPDVARFVVINCERGGLRVKSTRTS